MSEQQDGRGWSSPDHMHIDSSSLDLVPTIPVVIVCCGCGARLDAGPSIAAGWLPLLVQCQGCGAR